MTSIALSPRSCASVYLRLGSSIRFSRRRNHAVAIGAAVRQFPLQPLRFVFQAHPAQFTNAPDEIIRPALVFRDIVALWLFERRWHGCPPASFLLLAPGRAQRNVLKSQFRLPIDRAPFYGRNSRRSRQNLSFDSIGLPAQGYRRAPQHIAAENWLAARDLQNLRLLRR